MTNIDRYARDLDIFNVGESFSWWTGCWSLPLSWAVASWYPIVCPVALVAVLCQSCFFITRRDPLDREASSFVTPWLFSLDVLPWFSSMEGQPMSTLRWDTQEPLQSVLSVHLSSWPLHQHGPFKELTRQKGNGVVAYTDAVSPLSLVYCVVGKPNST